MRPIRSQACIHGEPVQHTAPVGAHLLACDSEVIAHRAQVGAIPVTVVMAAFKSGQQFFPHALFTEPASPRLQQVLVIAGQPFRQPQVAPAPVGNQQMGKLVVGRPVAGEVFKGEIRVNHKQDFVGNLAIDLPPGHRLMGTRGVDANPNAITRQLPEGGDKIAGDLRQPAMQALLLALRQGIVVLDLQPLLAMANALHIGACISMSDTGHQHAQQ